MTLLVALLLSAPFPTSMTARQGHSLDGGYRAWAVEVVSGITATVQGVIYLADAGPPLNVNFPATQPVSAAALPLPAGAATGAKQDTGNTSLSSIDGKLPALAGGKVPVDIGASIVSVTGGLTDTQLRASAVPVSLATAPTTPVTGTFFQATQPVSIASMPSTPVTGAFFQGTQPVSAAALPLPAGAATDSTLSQLLDGGVLARGLAPSGAAVAIAVDPGGVQYFAAPRLPPLNPFFPRCNPVRRTGCQP